MEKASNLLYEKESYDIIGACIEVYKELVSGFLEAVYQECLEHEFNSRNIPYKSQPQLEMTYKGIILSKSYQPDFICYDKIIVELKAVSLLLDEHKSQVLNYLKATKLKLGLLINFGHYPLIEKARIIS